MNTESIREVPRIIYQFWTGDNPITECRLAGVKSLDENVKVKTVLLNKKEIKDALLPEVPLHPAYPYLNEVKQSDYLRCYFLHHFGGGYADIKIYSGNNNWDFCLDYINEHPEIEVIGQKECHGGAAFPEWNEPDTLRKLVANSYFIVRPYSEFSTKWWNAVNAKLDDKYEALKARPARCPRERGSDYPLRWAELQGEIFHQLCIDYFETGKVDNRLVSGRKFVPYQ